MSTIVAAMSGVPITLIDAKTTGTSDAIAIPTSFIHHNFMITATTGTTSGKVQIETSNDPADTNTWAAVGAETTVVAAADLLVEYEGRLNFARARVTTTIAGGSGPAVTVVYVGAKNY